MILKLLLSKLLVSKLLKKKSSSTTTKTVLPNNLPPNEQKALEIINANINKIAYGNLINPNGLEKTLN